MQELTTVDMLSQYSNNRLWELSQEQPFCDKVRAALPSIDRELAELAKVDWAACLCQQFEGGGDGSGKRLLLLQSTKHVAQCILGEESWYVQPQIGIPHELEVIKKAMQLIRTHGAPFSFSRKEFSGLRHSYLTCGPDIFRYEHKRPFVVGGWRIPGNRGAIIGSGSETVVSRIWKLEAKRWKPWVKLKFQEGQGAGVWDALDKLAGLDLPGLPRLIEVDEDKKVLVMPQASCDLHTRLKRGGLTIQQRVQIVLQLAQDLMLIHQHGAHRDIKSENVLIMGMEQRAVISDFGMFSSKNDLSIKGTLHVVAPEALPVDFLPRMQEILAYAGLNMGSFQGTLNEWRRTDVYSFGHLLFEVVLAHDSACTRRLWRRTESIEGVDNKEAFVWNTIKIVISAEKAELSHHIYDETIRLIRWCMHWNPATRPTMAQVAAALLEIQQLANRQEDLNPRNPKRKNSRTDSP